MNPGRRLPEITLPSVPDGTPLPIRTRGRNARVLLLLHPDCPECGEYHRAIGERAAELQEWDGRVLAVLAGPIDADVPAQDRATDTAVDTDRTVPGALSVREPAVVVADQWGVIHAAEEAGAEHRFPEPEALVEWARYLAIRCPECEGEAL